MLKPPPSPFLEILGFKIHYYSITMLLSISLLYYIYLKYSKIKLKDRELIGLIFLTIISSRIYHILTEYSYYASHPKEILRIDKGGLSIIGTILGGLTYLYLISKKNNLNLIQLLNPIIIYLPLAQAIGRIGNYFNQELYGKPYDGALSLYVDEKYRLEGYKNIETYHPLFLYEIILNLAIFTLLKKMCKTNFTQNLTLYYLLFYFLGRTILEMFKLDETVKIGGVGINLYISLTIVLTLIVKLMRKDKTYEKK